MKTLRQAGGLLFATAGVGLGVFAWAALIAWWWGLLAVLLFWLGWRLLSGGRSGRELDGGGCMGNDLVGGDIDILD